MISVCLATYNGQRFIKRQITSILSQIGEEDEVVVSDDGSTDDTLTILRDLNDSRIRIIDGAHRHSPTWNFEKALEGARGEYIFLSDQDDVWMPEKVSVTMKYLQQYDCVVSDNVIVDAEGSVIADSFYAINKIGAIANMIHPLSAEGELLYCLKQSKSDYILCIDFA